VGLNWVGVSWVILTRSFCIAGGTLLRGALLELARGRIGCEKRRSKA